MRYQYLILLVDSSTIEFYTTSFIDYDAVVKLANSLKNDSQSVKIIELIDGYTLIEKKEIK